MKYLSDRVVIDPKICDGEPVIVGTQVSIRTILGHLALGKTQEDIVNNIPSLTISDIRASIEFMDRIVRRELEYDFWGESKVEEEQPEYTKVNRIWKHIEFGKEWEGCDTSILDDIKDSWFDHRKILLENSKEYNDFLTRLKREHAIETGIVERMYDLSRSITETLIKEGFDAALLSHDDSNIPTHALMKHLNDHLDAVDFVFDVVKTNRSLSISFIKELHQLVTRHQLHAEGRDQFGTRLKIQLLSGEFKMRENNPTREDGTKILYCPPEHVSSEMDNLLSIYNTLCEKDIHPLIIATWFHHAFTTIHPFQDGNGRVARLLASLIFIKNGFFPFTVLREDAKSKYIDGLESADKGNPQPLISYFAKVQRRNIQNALNLKGVSNSSLIEVQNILVTKIRDLRKKAEAEHQHFIEKSRNTVFEFCHSSLVELTEKLEKKLGKWAQVSIFNCPFFESKINDNGVKLTDYYFKQIVGYAKLHDYYFNRTLPKAWVAINIQLSPDKKYRLVVTLHHYGYQRTTLAIGAFLELKYLENSDLLDSVLPLPIPPHVISISGDFSMKEKNINQFLENALTLSIGQIASEM